MKQFLLGMIAVSLLSGCASTGTTNNQGTVPGDDESGPSYTVPTNNTQMNQGTMNAAKMISPIIQ